MKTGFQLKEVFDREIRYHQSCLTEEVFRMIKWDTEGIKVNGSYLRELRFADDGVPIASSATELKRMIGKLQKAGNKAGLENNFEKPF